MQRFWFLLCPPLHPTPLNSYWDHANDEADLDGYEIYVRTGVPGATYQFLAAVYIDELEDPDNPTVTITDLYNGLLTDLIPPLVRMAELDNNSTYHFALTAFDTQGNTSDFSEELCVEVIGTSVVECGSADTIGDSDGEGAVVVMFLLKTTLIVVATVAVEVAAGVLSPLHLSDFVRQLYFCFPRSKHPNIGILHRS